MLETTLPVFVLVALGFVAGRTSVLPAAGVASLGAFVIYLALPAVLFLALAQDFDHSTLDVAVLAAYVGASLALQLTVTWIALRWRRRSLHEAVALGTGTVHANSALVGLPIGLALFGPGAAVMLAFYVSFEMVVLFPLMTVLAGWRERRGNNGLTRHCLQTVVPLAKNPLILAIAAGFLTRQLSITLPQVLETSLLSLSNACVPVALLYIGAVLATQRLSGEGRQLAFIATGKLILHPAAVALVLFALPAADPLQAKAAIINAGMPLATVFPLLAARCDQGRFWPGAVVVTTLLSFLTLTVLIKLTGLAS
ncbi:AEC family transporter [Parahaliea aestuarii]|uniref:AEC family transporter n=1 Tax=Parahaliea aestuarii TaxID=1852021 RepID=UPI00164FDD16|nr:AEC family transporter [Parahaliea aestuarii]